MWHILLARPLSTRVFFAILGVIQISQLEKTNATTEETLVLCKEKNVQLSETKKSLQNQLDELEAKKTEADARIKKLVAEHAAALQRLQDLQAHGSSLQVDMIEPNRIDRNV